MLEMADQGLTHVAYNVSELDESLAFYAKYAGMRVVHQRGREGGSRVAWISDATRPFVLVLIEERRRRWLRFPTSWRGRRRGCFSHLGVACASRGELDALVHRARTEGVLEAGPRELPPPAGYLALLRDPDGYTLELSVGQEVGRAVGA